MEFLLPIYHDRDVWDNLDEDELAPEDVEGHVEWVQTHRRALDGCAIGVRIRLKIFE